MCNGFGKVFHVVFLKKSKKLLTFFLMRHSSIMRCRLLSAARCLPFSILLAFYLYFFSQMVHEIVNFVYICNLLMAFAWF